MAKSKKRTVRREEEVVAPDEVQERYDAAEEPDRRSPLAKVIIILLILLGLYLIVSFISDRQDGSGDKAAKDDESSKVEKSDKADKDDKDKKADTADKAASDSENLANGTRVEETDKEFSFTVGGGESYTTLARRAIASADSKLSHAERVAAETKLVNDANAEWLNEGQNLTVSKDAVRAAIDWAKSLSAEQKAVWQPYADMIAW